MTPAEELRAAAAKMRELATASLDANGTDWYGPDDMADVLAASLPDNKTEVDAAHIVGWSPAVALAVADWLDVVAFRHGDTPDHHGLCASGHWEHSRPGFRDWVADPCPDMIAALAVARAFLGTTP